MSTPTFTNTGVKATSAATLPKTVFGVEVENADLVKQAYLAYQANGRSVNAKTKTRGEVSGGGKKPWKQKGTGRARFGSIRVPIWRGGGITFGPTGTQNFTHDLPLETKRTALRHALSLKNKNGSIVVVDSLASKDGKTKSFKALLDKIGATRNVLVVTEHKDEQLVRATNNLPSVNLVHAMYLNVFSVMNADTIVLSSKAIETIEKWLGGKK